MVQKFSSEELFTMCFISFLRDKGTHIFNEKCSIAEQISFIPGVPYRLMLSVTYNEKDGKPSIDVADAFFHKSEELN